MVILAVDDEPFLAELIQEALEREGHIDGLKFCGTSKPRRRNASPDYS